MKPIFQIPPLGVFWGLGTWGLEFPQRRGRRGGFTLIEVCISLILVMLILSIGISLVRSGMREHQLRSLRDEVVRAAGEARLESMRTGKPVALGIEATGMRVLDPLAEEDDQEISPVDFGDGVHVEVQVWPSDRWTGLRDMVEWHFQPNGLCEPIAFRMVRGRSWISFSIHPLTADIDAETFELGREK